ncbi:MAG: sugar phosphate isomerase/epimerase [Clostridia bacterium]|nr:sugar phosphate isomerase/epimerase [Clostridia bacterium]
MSEVKIGLQMYSVKPQIAELGLETVLKALSEAGVRNLELAGYYGLTPMEFKMLLDRFGLTAIAAHVKPSDTETALEYIDLLGIKKVYVPIVPLRRFDEGEYQILLDDIKAAKAIFDTRGITYGYHNHKQEYEDGADRVRLLLDEIEGFTSELDIFWATAAGRDPVLLTREYGKRLSALHIRDMDPRADISDPTAYPHAIAGEGKCRAYECYKAAREAGVDTFILEVGSYPIDYIEYIRRSFENIKGFEAKMQEGEI